MLFRSVALQEEKPWLNLVAGFFMSQLLVLHENAELVIGVSGETVPVHTFDIVVLSLSDAPVAAGCKKINHSVILIVKIIVIH
jgi:hypothetical protein